MATAVGTGLHDQVASARARLILNALRRMCRTGPAVLPGRHTVNVPGEDGAKLQRLGLAKTDPLVVRVVHRWVQPAA